MRRREIVSILFVVFVSSESRVTFPFSNVVQILSSDSNIECPDGCKVYVNIGTTEGGISKGGNGYGGSYSEGPNYVASFKDILGDKPSEPKGYTLPASETGYAMQGSGYNKGYYGYSSSNFVLYAVNKNAPNNDTHVFVPQGDQEMMVDGENRYATFLSNFDALIFFKFRGVFPTGYPKIYATGYDVVGDLFEGTRCVPVYQARSQVNAEQSILTITSPIVTVDFGYVGKHTVSTKKGDRGKPHKSPISSTVYMSPGFVGCPFTGKQMYSKKEDRFSDKFTMISNGLDISAFSYDTFNTLKLTVNQDTFNYNSMPPSFFKYKYGKGAFTVALEWYTSSPRSMTLQLDFGTKQPTLAKPSEEHHKETFTTTQAGETTTSTADQNSESAQQCNCCYRLQSEMAEIRITSVNKEAEGVFSIGWKWLAALAVVGIVALVLYRRRSNQ